MPKYSYFVVEGPHDVAFVSRFLRIAGLSHIQKLSSLDPFWRDLVPREFPHEDDLLKRMPVPWFYANSDYSVAIMSAIGDSRISENIEETFAVAEWGPGDLEGIGLILDADSEQEPQERFNSLISEIERKIPDIYLPDALGTIHEGTPKSGIFIMPNNNDAGTLHPELSFKNTVASGCKNL